MTEEEQTDFEIPVRESVLRPIVEFLSKEPYWRVYKVLGPLVATIEAFEPPKGDSDGD